MSENESPNLQPAYDVSMRGDMPVYHNDKGSPDDDFQIYDQAWE